MLLFLFLLCPLFTTSACTQCENLELSMTVISDGQHGLVLCQGSTKPVQQCPAGNTNLQGFLAEDQDDSLKPVNVMCLLTLKWGSVKLCLAALY